MRTSLSFVFVWHVQLGRCFLDLRCERNDNSDIKVHSSAACPLHYALRRAGRQSMAGGGFVVRYCTMTESCVECS
eukprot:2190193-Amphidinium_carterae.1